MHVDLVVAGVASGIDIPRPIPDDDSVLAGGADGLEDPLHWLLAQVMAAVQLHPHQVLAGPGLVIVHGG